MWEVLFYYPHFTDEETETRVLQDYTIRHWPRPVGLLSTSYMVSTIKVQNMCGTLSTARLPNNIAKCYSRSTYRVFLEQRERGVPAHVWRVEW